MSDESKRSDINKLLTEKNRQLFLGPDLYLKCNRKGTPGLTPDALKQRLAMWKDNVDLQIQLDDGEKVNLFDKCTI